MVLAHGSALLQARVQLTLAEMVLAEAAQPQQLAHCHTHVALLLRGAADAASAAEDFRLAATAAELLAWLHHGQGREEEREAAAALREEYLRRQEEVEAACGAEGRVLAGMEGVQVGA